MDFELRSLYDGSDLAAKVVWDRPNEMFREGYDLAGRIPKPRKSGTPTDAATDVPDSDVKNLRDYATENFEVDSTVHESAGWGRLFGGCLDIMGIDDGGYPWEPVNEDRIRSFDFLSLVDRRYAYVQSQYAGINAKKYGSAQIYLISNAIAGSGWNDHGDVRARTPQELQSGGAQIQLVHSSRVIRFDGNPADVQSRQRLAGWSWSVLQRVYNAFRQFEHAFDSAAYLLSDASQGVLKMVGLMKAISAGNRQAIQDRALAMDMTRSVLRGMVLDAGDKNGNGAESYERTPTPLAGISDILEQMKSRFAAAANEPQTKLFGRSPAGLSATGDSDMRLWYDDVRSEANVKVAPKLRRIYRYIALSKDSPMKGKKIDFTITFKPLWSPTDGEIATANLARAQTAVALVGATMIPEEVAALTWTDEYPALDVEAIEEALETKTTFDPHEGDPDPEPGQPGGPPLLPPAAGGGGISGPAAPGSKDEDPNAGTGEPLSAAAPIPPIGPGPRLTKPLPGQTPSVATPPGKSGTPNPGQQAKVPPKLAPAGDAPPNRGTGAVPVQEPTAGAAKPGTTGPLQATPPETKPPETDDDIPPGKGVPHVVVHPDEDPTFHATKSAAKAHAKDLVKKGGGKAKVLPAAEFLQKQASWSAKNPKHPATGQFTGSQESKQAQDRSDRADLVEFLADSETVEHEDWRFDSSGWDLSDDHAIARLDSMTATRKDGGEARKVFRQLLKCYPASCLGWVLAAHWYRQQVPLDQIDMSGRARWTASKDGKTQKHVDLIKEGKSDPVILVSPPGNAKDVISDGHHRVLAYESMGLPVEAYVAEVHTDAANAPWRVLHGAQKRGSSIGSVSIEPSIPAEVDAMPAPRVDAQPPVRTEQGAFTRGEMSEDVETPHGKGHVQLRVLPSGEHVFSARGETSPGTLGKQTHVRIPAKDASPERLEAEADARRTVAHAHGLSSEVRTQAHALAHAMRGRAETLRQTSRSDAQGAPPDKHAVICLVFDEQGRVLTVSRPEPPQEMSIPGGMVDQNEDPATTAWRELYEETGVSICDLRYRTQLVSPFDGRPVQVFVAGGYEGEAYAAEPDTKVEWMSVEDLVRQSQIYRPCLESLIDSGDLKPQGRPGVIRSEVPRAQRAPDPRETDMGGSHVHGPGDRGGANDSREAGTVDLTTVPGGPPDAVMVIARSPDQQKVMGVQAKGSKSWSLPFGRIIANEAREAASRRIFEQQSGLHALQVESSSVLKSPIDGATIHVYLCPRWEGEPKPGKDVTEVEWVTPLDLLKKSGPMSPAIEEIMQEGHQRPASPIASPLGDQSRLHMPDGLSLAPAGALRTVIGSEDTKAPTPVETGRALDSEEDKAKRQKEALEAGEPDPVEASEASVGPTSTALQPTPRADECSIEDLPADFGTEVPPAGSHCANCSFLASTAPPTCGNETFAKWVELRKKIGNGETPALIPAPDKDPAKYCCSAWEMAKSDANDDDDEEAIEWLYTSIAEGVVDAIEAYAKDLPEDTADADDWDQSKHPRAPNGEFGEGGGGEAGKGAGGEKPAPASSGGRLRSMLHSVVSKIRGAPAAIGRAALHEAKEKIHEFKSAALGVKAFLHPPPSITTDQKKDIGRVAVFAVTSILASHVTPLLAIGHFVHAEASAVVLEKIADQALHHVFEKFSRKGLRLDSITLDWNPDQDRDEKGRFGSGGSEGAGPKVGSASGVGFSEKATSGVPAQAVQHENDPEKLFAEAKKAHEEQLDLLNRGKGVGSDIGAKTVRADLGVNPTEAAKESGPIVVIGPMKTRESFDRKVRDEGGTQGPASVTDIVRSTIAVDSMSQVHDVVQKLEERGAKLAALPKDRFSNPTEAGYRDLMLKVQYPSGHVGEIQVQLKPMLAAKEGGHRLYETSRALQPKVQSRSMTKDNWHTYDHAMREQRKLYDAAWTKASAHAEGGGSTNSAASAPREASPKEFKAAFDAAFKDHPLTSFVSHYSEAELAGMKTLLANDGKTGIAVHDHGDGRVEGTALFNNGGPKGAGIELLKHAIDHAGVNYLECYGEQLRQAYEKAGFAVTSSSPFNREYAAPDWNYEKHGTPNYYTLSRS